MQRDFWLQAWAAGRTGFHSDETHPTLIAHEARFLGDGPHRLLVPLCGRSVDLLWLRERGHEVVGVEFAPAAVEAFCSLHGLDAVRREIEHGFVLEAPGIRLVCADFFALDPAEVGPVDRIWDRASLVAIDPARRVEYAAQIRRLGRPGALTLLEAFEYDPSVMEGPPWSVPRAEVETLYASFEREQLACVDASDRVKFKGHETFLVHAWLLKAP